MNESTTKGRMPMRGDEAKAQTGKSMASKQLPVPSNMAAHVPVRGESATAMMGKPVDGLAKMAGQSAMVGQGDGYKLPVRSAEVVVPPSKSA
jgi:hypothetical protein